MISRYFLSTIQKPISAFRMVLQYQSSQSLTKSQVLDQKQLLEDFQSEKQQNNNNNKQDQKQYQSDSFNAKLLLPIFVILNERLQKVACLFSKSNDQLGKNLLQNRATVLQYPANKPTEDRANCYQLQTIKGFVCQILDGHGGCQVSEFANQNMREALEAALKKNKEKFAPDDDEYIIQSLKDTFDSIEFQYLERAKEQYKNGIGKAAGVGSCALITVITNNKLYSANIGDCKGILVEKQSSEFLATKINQKFNANSKKEQKRLRQQFPNEKDIVVCKRNDSKACYVKSRLQPTRAFGDFRLKHPEFNNPENREGFSRQIPNFNGPYITHVPDVKVFELTPQHKYLIMGTDGLWDEMKPKDICSILNQTANDKNEIIQNLIKNAFQVISKRTNIPIDQLQNIPLSQRRHLHDDISIIVVDLKNQTS